MLTTDLREEGDTLYALLESAGPTLGSRVTQFKGWSAWDVLAHLHDSDQLALAALGDEDEFNKILTSIMTAMGGGESAIDFSRRRLGSMPYLDLVRKWRATFQQMCDAFDETDPERKLPWFGPPMRVRMFATARLMETWAHGQALFDLMGLERVESDRIRNVVFIGVRTYSFCFVNRGLTVPEPMPFVDLEAPSGARWTYGDESDTDFVRGSAVDFAKVVTQVRNVADTELVVSGEAATEWMAIAQCFAGLPEDPPKSGTRHPSPQ